MPQRILIIDDEQSVRKLIAEILQFAGFETIDAGCGEDGVALAAEFFPHMIICDVSMPGIDGFETLARVRQIDELSATPFIFLTGRTDRKDIRHGMSSGADDYLTKPFDLEILQARMQALIRRHSGAVAASELRYQDITLHLKTGKAYRQEKLLVLTPTTFTLLKMLVSAAPNLVTKEEMAYQLWGEDKPSPDVLRSHIYQLRSQLDKPFESQILKTRPKIGFYLEGDQ